ncbi:hypothetical protein J6590_014871 [Homalodisca vitripennis]|nr:hypothetical protein J6590_014871 [Homalodisca vitripennis]
MCSLRCSFLLVLNGQRRHSNFGSTLHSYFLCLKRFFLCLYALPQTSQQNDTGTPLPCRPAEHFNAVRHQHSSATEKAMRNRLFFLFVHIFLINNFTKVSTDWSHKDPKYTGV